MYTSSSVSSSVGIAVKIWLLLWHHRLLAASHRPKNQLRNLLFADYELVQLSIVSDVSLSPYYIFAAGESSMLVNMSLTYRVNKCNNIHA